MTAAPATSPKNWYIFLFISFYLIAQLLWRLFVPAHEYPSRSAQVLEMVLDAMMVVGIFGLRGQLLAAMPESDGRKSFGALLSIVAIIAGVGLFLIRFTSDAAWWTGHLQYSLN